MKHLPSFETYCENTTPANALVFYMDGITVWFSYKTPVAFRIIGNGNVAKRIVRVNTWGPTTGKHLNAIDGGAKDDRIPGDAFEAQLQKALA